MGDDRRGLRFVGCCLLLVAIGFALRLLPLTRYVTPDEPAWVHRSITFAQAFGNRAWTEIPTTGHPGVTTMWLGSTAVKLQQWLTPEASSVHLDWVLRMAWLAPENGEAFRHLAFFLPAGRIAVAVATSLLLAAVAAAVNRLWGREAAMLSLALLAFDPYLIGHSGLLHTDALLASFCALAVLAALNAMRTESPHRWWALAGLSTGLAILTKTPGVILIAVVPAMSVTGAFLTWSDSPDVPRRVARGVGELVVYSLCAGVTVVALYPALWSDPLGVVQSLTGFAGDHLATVQRPIFFAGEMTYDPGAAFYPLVLIFRSSPVVLLGVALGFARLSRLSVDQRFSFLMLVAFAVLFGLIMGVGAKKHDRYLLPALVSLSVAASLLPAGLEDLTGRARLIPPLAAVLQLCIALVFALHPLTYFNPVLGGPAVATRILPSGWGETMGSAAAWLNRVPGAEQLTVAAISPPSFAPLFLGRTVPLDDESVALADYVVDLVPRSSEVEGLRTSTAHTVTIGSLQPALVISNSGHMELAQYLRRRTGAGDLIIVDADVPLLRLYQGQASIECAADIPDEKSVTEWMSEIVPDTESVWLVSSAGASPITGAQLERQMASLGTPVTESTFALYSVAQYAPASPLTPVAPRFDAAIYGGELVLVDVASPPSAAWPDSLPVTLRWRITASPPGDYRAVVTLRDATGFEWSRLDRLILNSVTFPTSAWLPGEWADASYGLRVPAGIPPGQYSVEVGVYDAATGAGQGASGPDGAFLGTQVPATSVSVLPPSEPPGRAALQVPMEVDSPAGPLKLLGLHLPRSQALSGDYLSLLLFWETSSRPEVDYIARLTLADTSLNPVVRAEHPLSSYPSSQWEPGQRFKTHHFVHLSPTLPADEYHLTLNLVDEDGNPAWPMDQPLTTITVLPRDRSFEMPSNIPLPLDYQFGDVARLLGCNLDQVELSPGQTLQLTLFWQAQGNTRTEYTLFAHLLDSGRHIRGQVDLTPGSGSAPSTSWAPGQVIIDEISIALDPDASPGPYHLAIGLYDRSYGTRLCVTDGGGEVLADYQAILPLVINVLGGTE